MDVNLILDQVDTWLWMYLHSQDDLYRFSGLLVGRGKKVKFFGIFRDKFMEKTADFTGISLEFSTPIWLKNNWYRTAGFVRASRANFAGKLLVLC